MSFGEQSWTEVFPQADPAYMLALDTAFEELCEHWLDLIEADEE